MYQEVKDYIGSCDICQRTKVDRRQQPPPLNPLPVVDTFDRVHIDVLGPLPKTKQGYQFILLIIDSSSKWSEAFTLCSQEAKEIANIFYNKFICRYGAPRVLVSDRGRNFMSKLLSALCEMVQIKRHHTSSYHPQTNATVERANSTLAKALTAYVSDHQTDWPDYLDSVMMAFRSTPATESTQLSPYYILFGKEMNLPIDVDLIPKPNLPKNAKDYIEHIHKSLTIVKNIAQENIKISQQKAKQNYDTKSKMPNFRINDYVLLRNHVTKTGISSKLTKKWVGPYKIVSKGPNFTYKILDSQTGKLHKSLVNASRLKHYQQSVNSDSSDEEDLSDNIPNSQNNNTSQPQNASPQTQMDNPNQPSQVTNTQSTSVTGSQPKSQQNSLKIKKILQTKMYSKTRYFRVQWDDETAPNSWITEDQIDPNILEKYWETHTRKGRKRKYKTRLFVHKKPDQM